MAYACLAGGAAVEAHVRVSNSRSLRAHLRAGLRHTNEPLTYEPWGGRTAGGQRVWEALRVDSMPGRRLPVGVASIMLERDEVPLAVWRGWAAA